MHPICREAIGLALDHKIVKMCWEQNASELHTQLFGLVSLVQIIILKPIKHFRLTSCSLR